MKLDEAYVFRPGDRCVLAHRIDTQIQHFPARRAPYNVVTADPALVPDLESLHVLPTQTQPYTYAPHAHPLAPLPGVPAPKRSPSTVPILGPPLKHRRCRAAYTLLPMPRAPNSAPHTNDAPRAPVPSIAIPDAPKSAPPTGGSSTAPQAPPPHLHSPPRPLLSPRSAPALARTSRTPPSPPPCGLVEAAYRGLDAALAGRAGRGAHPIPPLLIAFPASIHPSPP
ncbi:hypothetical protein C8J57DRAFT_1723164 [Mycena rebaudengoi]|nr:hypothetical protein C8J57DRAFT_1723164 [Mycena rebaudengoi]